MKKVISVALMVLMLLVAVHPVLAMHYCGGKLRSFAYAGNGSPACCKAMSHHSFEEQDEESSGLKHSSGFLSRTCCHNQVLELATDDFSAQTQSLSLTDEHSASIVAWITCLVLYPALGSPNQDKVTYFQPGGLQQSGSDFLAYLCTYRI